MKQNKRTITESQLRKIISETIEKSLKEGIFNKKNHSDNTLYGISNNTKKDWRSLDAKKSQEFNLPQILCRILSKNGTVYDLDTFHENYRTVLNGNEIDIYPRYFPDEDGSSYDLEIDSAKNFPSYTIKIQANRTLFPNYKVGGEDNITQTFNN